MIIKTKNLTMQQNLLNNLDITSSQIRDRVLLQICLLKWNFPLAQLLAIWLDYLKKFPSSTTSAWTDINEVISLESLIWSQCCCSINYEKSDKIKSCKCDKIKVLKDTYFLTSAEVLVINTMRLKNDKNVIKTKIDVLFQLNISKVICGMYANVSEISHYKLGAVINFDGSSTTRGHFIAHIFDFNDNGS